MSVIANLAMSTILQKLEGDKVDEDPPAISKRSILVGVLRKIEQQ